MRARDQALSLAEKSVHQREKDCAVSSAQALHMVSEAQREVLESQDREAALKQQIDKVTFFRMK
jgi:hypothetical protein